jgi:ATP adenylyltransferase
MPIQFQNLFSTNKLGYIKDGTNRKECILCSIAGGDAEVGKLLVTQGEHIAVCVNKFPYNPGHLMIFPRRHITDVRSLEEFEELELNRLVREALGILDSLYSPSGYNIGYNMGEFAGASIAHLHMHVIPRYQNELGYIDIIGGAKIIVEDPVETMKRLRKAFREKRPPSSEPR